MFEKSYYSFNFYKLSNLAKMAHFWQFLLRVRFSPIMLQLYLEEFSNYHGIHVDYIRSLTIF